MTRSHSKLIFIILLAMFSSTAFAHTVTMNFRFHITDVNDTIRINDTSYTGQAESLSFTSLPKPYVSSERSGTLLAIITDNLLNAAVDTQSDPYLFQLTQNENRRFLITLTNGTWQTVDGINGIPATTFGVAPKPSVTAGLAMQLRFDTLDITGILGPGQMLIKSLGILRVPKINVEVIG